MKDFSEGVYEDCFNNIKLLVGMMQIQFIYPAIIIYIYITEPILDSKGMCVIIKKRAQKGKKYLKRAKYQQIWAKMYNI